MSPHPRTVAVCGAFLIGLGVLVVPPFRGRENAGADAPVALPLPTICATKLQAPALTWRPWDDVEGRLRQANRNVVQRAADLFAWQDFIALNWPARSDGRGEAATDQPFTASGYRVWETWKGLDEVYLPDGARPADWNAPLSLPAGLNDSLVIKVLHRRQKVDEILQGELQPTLADGSRPGTLTDQRGHVVHYEIRMNRVFFDFVVKNQLYDARQQAALDAVIVPDGAILIKAAWRDVAPEEQDRFHTVDAYVADHRNPRRVQYEKRRVGLVGFHIMHKTASAPQWLWATFEQSDNVAGPQPSFHNPRSRHGLVNRQTEPGVPNQVTRVWPIPDREPDCAAAGQAVDNVVRLNRDIQQGLGPSVFRHYGLIGTQWPLPKAVEDRIPATVFAVVPEVLANTTIETYIQETSTCMGCHALARTTRADRFVSAGFSYTLGHALPKLAHATPLPPPATPVTAFDKEHWNSILRGHDLATRTYELLPAYVPTARLHCQSCHLNACGNPDASWWVGMMAKHQYPGTDHLPARINRCLRRSMNGKPLCDDSDRTNPHMNALIRYMQWLDEQAAARHLPLPASPFPPVPARTGSAEAGRGIYRQKCAFCHNADGQGRYDSHHYYRPALWGNHSYRRDAGMARPATLAAFIHANMPYGSGGMLTAQEAWDLAEYVLAHERP